MRYFTLSKTFITGVSIFFIGLNSMFSQNLQISGGNNFSVSLCSDGKVFAWGKNDAGQLGRNSSNVKYPEAFFTTPRLVYLPVANSLTMKQVDAGSGNTGIALACDGSVWQWGGNCGNGNIGNGVSGSSCSGSPLDGSDYYSAMQQVVAGAQGAGFLTNIRYINASTQSSFAVENTGRVLAWGNNSTGALGNGTTSSGSPYTPSYVLTAAATPLTNIRTVEGTDYSGYALSNDGYVYSWGGNTNNDLGRTISGDQYYAKRVRAWDYSKGDGSLVDLSGIVKMTGGDTHGMAIDVNGDLWSWGGDWGPGQRGGGSCGCNNPAYATKVISPAATCAQDAWKIGPWLTDAVDISAGQQHSIVLLSNGKVLTFGNNSSGQLGNGTTTSTGCPVYVKTDATTDLTNIVSISDGDLWSFALTSSGQVYVWGENANGELGIPGVTTDQTFATLNTAIPTACSGSLLPCPTATLGPDVLKCPGSSVTLLAGSNGDSYLYTWFSSPSATGPWTQIGATDQPYNAGAGAQLTVTTPLFYRVEIRDTRTYVADKCSACAYSRDTLQVIDRTPPLSTNAAGSCGTDVCFDISSTGAIDNNAFDWYANQTTATKLNTAGTVNPFCTAKTNLTLNAGNYEIWVEDKREFQSTVGPTTVPAGCATPSGSSGGVPANKYQQEFVVYDTITITSVQIYYRTYNVSATPDQMRINVYSNDPNKNSSSKDGVSTILPITSAVVNVPRASTDFALITLTGLNLVLPGQTGGIKYWLEPQLTVSNGELAEYTCAASYPYSDAIVGTDVVILKGSTASAQEVQQVNYNANAFNWNFKYEDGYPCGRFKLSAPDATTACLPVEFLYFHGENKGSVNILTWATGSETNSGHFEIMRSYDGMEWVKAGQVAAAGNSSSLREYSFNDQLLKSGLVYYKIIERDIDGNTTISQIITINTSVSTDMLIHPNPNNGTFTIETNGGFGENTQVSIYDAIGKLIFSTTDNFSTSASKDFSLNGINSGVYYITLADGYFRNTEKMIVK